jgi:uncharacterized protein YigE (DUF2233 family)
MPTALSRALAASLLIVAALASAAIAQTAGPAELCRPFSFEDAGYVVCTVDLRRARLGLFWKGADGEPYGGFERLRQAPEGQGLAFAMNGGMYHKDASPVGLYVENGRELKRANTADGPGNFHLKPNGVFYAKGDSAGVLETARFLRQRPPADIATQSGPMLVIDGKIHPKISDEGASRKRRNGVGVRDRHTVVFAISDGPVSFGSFARLFRDGLGCRNALFLDGSISSLYAPNLGRADGLYPMGPIIGAFERSGRAAR